ncbi:hypothetical protein ACU686_05145 [Yinghuangia aomiensis]
MPMSALIIRTAIERVTGHAADVTEQADRTRISTRHSPPSERWLDLLAAIATADAWGCEFATGQPPLIWAEIHHCEGES